MCQRENYLATSESVTEGHPDKVADQISDAVLDEVLKNDPNARVACETFVSVGLVVVGGEITTDCYVDLPRLVRSVIKDIGYTNPNNGFQYESCAVLSAIGRQSPDIAQGVDTGGAGDQGLMFGYATNETPELMPLPIALSHKLVKSLADVRKSGTLKYLGPDGKSQVTVEYKNGAPARIDSIIIATQHDESVLTQDGKHMTEESKNQIWEKVVLPVVPKELLDKDTKYFVNQTGKFVVGGPQSDTGVTGRKIIVDTYGGAVPHGGGAFSGKDPTKVDRSASYAARHIAKNIVGSGVADKCQVMLSYVIGKAEPTSLAIDTFGTGKISDDKLIELVKKNFDLTPKGIIKTLNLRRPIYRKTAAYGHFGRDEETFSWEKLDKVDVFKKGKVGSLVL